MSCLAACGPRVSFLARLTNMYPSEQNTVWRGGGPVTTNAGTSFGCVSLSPFLALPAPEEAEKGRSSQQQQQSKPKRARDDDRVGRHHPLDGLPCNNHIMNDRMQVYRIIRTD